MLALARDGEIPLPGPLSSIPGVHHGAAYYWLLGPVALLTDADPVAITLTLAVLGAGAGAATWWL